MPIDDFPPDQPQSSDENNDGLIEAVSAPRLAAPDKRENMRQLLAAAAMAILAAEVLFSIGYILLHGDSSEESIKIIKEFAQIFLGPTVAIVGSITGFYFGRN